jgi:tetratricopeptide (TPR) repeat protein
MKRVILLALLFFIAGNYSAAQTVQELIKQGDDAYAAFNTKQALEFYQKAEKKAPGDWEVLWRLSRAYVDLGEDMPEGTDEEKQLAQYEKALQYAEKSVKAAPDQSITVLRRAIANGRIALFKGVFSVAEVVNKVKTDSETAIKLGNGGNYVQALAHYVLGRTHAKISEKWAPARSVIGLGWAELETGIKELKKATEIYPDYRMFYYDLAKAYADNDEYDKARGVLKKLMDTPVRYKRDDKILADAKILMNEIKDE